MKGEGIESHCTFFDEDDFQERSFSCRQIMEHAFNEIDQSDFLFVLQTSENKSEGLLMEVGYCVAKNLPIMVAVKSGVDQTYVPDMGDLVIRWADVDHLVREISRVDFQTLKPLKRP